MTNTGPVANVLCSEGVLFLCGVFHGLGVLANCLLILVK